MTFKYPYLLLLIPFAVIAIFWIFYKKREPSSLYYPFSQRNFFKKINQRATKQLVPPLLFSVAIIFLIIAISRPQTSSTQVNRSAQGIDIMIAFDVSRSMLIEDFKTESRITLAKRTVKRFIRGRNDDRIGFLMFSGESITLCPPTLDYQVLENAVEAAAIGQLKDGTAIGDAIASSVNRLKNSKAKSKIIILLTDGDNNIGAITPLTAGSLAEGYGIKIYSIALGKNGNVAMPQYHYSFGQKVKTYAIVNNSINPKLLMEISKKTGGKFFRAAASSSLNRVFDEINKLEKTKVETKERVKWSEHYQPFLVISLLFFILATFLERTYFRIVPN